MIALTTHFYFNQESIFLEALTAIFSILYIFWPLIIFFGLRELFSKQHNLADRIRLAIQQIFVGWLAWVFFLGFIYWQNKQPFVLLPRALDHALFGSLGAITGGISLGWMIYRWRARRIRISDAQSLDDLLALSPDDFERVVAALFRCYGHDVTVSGGTSDHGVDVIVQATNGEKWIVQCKRYSGSVGEPIVRDLFGTMLHEDAQKAYLMTTGSISNQAREWALGKPIILYEGEDFVTLIRRTQRYTKRGVLR